MWKFFIKAQFPQNFHTRKLGEITVLYAVTDSNKQKQLHFSIGNQHFLFALQLEPFVANVPILYPLKTQENRKSFCIASVSHILRPSAVTCIPPSIIYNTINIHVTLLIYLLYCSIIYVHITLLYMHFSTFP